MSEICTSCGEDFDSNDGEEGLCPNCQGIEEDSSLDEFFDEEDE